MWAAGCVDGDGALAIRAGLLGGRGCRDFTFFQLAAEFTRRADGLDEQEQHDCHEQEVDDRRQERAVLDRDAADLPDEIGEVGVRDEADERRNDVANQRIDDAFERSADDHADGEIQHAAFGDECFKFRKELLHMVVPFDCI